MTLTEDLEFTTQCILDGDRVAWVPAAKTYDEQPLTFAQSWRQRCPLVGWHAAVPAPCTARASSATAAAPAASSMPAWTSCCSWFAPLLQALYLVTLALSGLLGALQIHFALAPYSDILYQPLFSAALSFVGTVVLRSASSLSSANRCSVWPKASWATGCS